MRSSYPKAKYSDNDVEGVVRKRHQRDNDAGLVEHLANADEREAAFWHRSFMHGVQLTCCRPANENDYSEHKRATSAARCWSWVFLIWKFAFASAMISSFTWSWVNCPNAVRLLYLTNNQTVAVLAYSIISLVCVIYLRCRFRHEIEFLTPTEERLEWCGPNWFVKFTWTFHVIAFSLTVWVSLLYFLPLLSGENQGQTFDANSMLAHAMPCLLMIMDFFLSGINWSMQDLAIVSLIACYYLIISILQWYFKWPRMGSHCQVDYAPPAYVYSSFNWSNWETSLAAALFVVIFAPLFHNIVWLSEHVVAYSIHRNCRGRTCC